MNWAEVTTELKLTLKPITSWPGRPTVSRTMSPFSAPIKDTLLILRRELGNLNAKNIVLQIDFRERDFRLDGLPRVNANANGPGVILSFDSVHGSLSLSFDGFRQYEHNLRAIAMHLEHLRKASMYGVGRSGEQYAGWKALPAPIDGPDLTTPHGAAWFIVKSMGADPDYGDNPRLVQRLQNDVGDFNTAYRKAAGFLHPDNGGNHDEFVKLQQARETLRRHHGAG